MRKDMFVLAAALAAGIACGCRTVQTPPDEATLKREAALDGDVMAQNWLGDAYGYGKAGIAIDRAEAAKWWRMAAEQGNASAMANLGECYRMGEGVEKDPVEAINWYRKGAELGDARSQRFLGGAYETGLGVPADRQEATKWWRLAADQGDVMAIMILRKLGIPRSPEAK